MTRRELNPQDRHPTGSRSFRSLDQARSEAYPDPRIGAGKVRTITDDKRVLTQRELDLLLAIAAEAGARLSGNYDAGYMTVCSVAGSSPGRTRVGAAADIEPGFALRANLVDDASHVNCWPFERLDDVVDGWWRSVHAEEAHRHRSSCGSQASLSDFGLGRRTLFVASMVDERAGHIVHAFAAFMAVDNKEVRSRLERRVGQRTAATANIVNGFDPSEPIAASLLSEAMSSILEDVALNPDSILAAGLDVLVEHRFA